MNLEIQDIQHIAHLARLQIETPQLEKYTQDLTNILNLVAEMDSVDTQHIKPMAHPLDLSQRLRADEITETNQRELFQSIAPLVENGLYLVPQVIED